MSTDIGPNWAGTHRFTAARLLAPRSLDAVVDAVVNASRVRALGTRHSFNDIADTSGSLITLVDLPPEPVIDSVASTVAVASGTPFGVLAGHLESNGFALHNLGSLPHISIAGACSTGTHGSGDGNGNLSTAVAALELVTGNGEVVRARRGDADFDGLVVALGAVGVVTRLTLDIQPSYRVRQDVYLDLPWETALAELDAIMAAAYSVSLFTDWAGPSLKQVWVKTRLDTGDELGAAREPAGRTTGDFFGARPAGSKVMSPADEGHDNTTVQGGVPGPWSERLPHFRPDATPSNGDEIQTEYFVDREHGAAALRTVRRLAAHIAPHLLVSELRTVAGDGLWLSPTQGRDSLAIHFTWRNHQSEVRALLPLIEAALEPFDPRPHWGKWFAMGVDTVAPKYARLERFRQLADRLDPAGRFRNAYLERTIGLPNG
jgi:xylitol oxidase